MKRALVGLICAIIAFEGLYFIWIAYSISTTLHLVPPGETADSLRRLTLYNSARGFFVLIAAVAYGTGWRQIRRWLFILSLPAVAYGIWVFRSWYALMISWRGVFTGDWVALGSASGIGFITIGALLIVERILMRKQARVE